jgi:hypothetical protein
MPSPVAAPLSYSVRPLRGRDKNLAARVLVRWPEDFLLDLELFTQMVELMCEH